MGSLQNPLSSIVNVIEPSKIAKFFQMAKDMKAQGVKVYDLTAGEPDFDTEDIIKQGAIQAIHDNITHYPNIMGEPRLRQAIQKKLQVENGLEYAVDEIIVSAGAKQSIFQALLVTVNDGDEAPYWTSYTSMVKFARGKPVIIQTDIDNNYKLTPELLQQHITPKTKIVLLNYPSNPTGVVYTGQELEALAGVLRKHPNIIIISDEIYEGITYPPHKHISFAALDGMFERTLTINGFSKTFAMTGWRLGYLAAPKTFALACYKVQSLNTSGVCSIAQYAAIAALEGLGDFGGEPVKKMVKQYQERKDYCGKQLGQIKGLKYSDPQGGFYFFVEVSNFFGENVSVEGYGPIKTSDDLIQYLINKSKVFMVPGDAFGVPSGLRLSYACDMQTLQAAMEQLKIYLDINHFKKK